ncbi:MAG: hypothetical protein LC792_16970 [Actinobacteria bacterium]|nr:hypothetical protein [Actinomycetota bacterium]
MLKPELRCIHGVLWEGFCPTCDEYLKSLRDCPDCGQVFPTYEALVAHHDTHADGEA